MNILTVSIENITKYLLNKIRRTHGKTSDKIDLYWLHKRNYTQQLLIQTSKGTKNLFELPNVRINNGFYKSFLSKEIKIWFELAKV